MKKLFILLVPFLFFLMGCTASDVTEEYEGEQKEVTYETPTSPTPTESQKPEQQTGVIQESNVNVQSQPEYIPLGPPTPPPPPVKVSLEAETETPKVEAPPTEGTDLYQYKVQVFAFKSRLNAESEAQKIRNRMPDQKVYVEYQDNLYKVRLGIYSKWEHAKGIKDALNNLGYTDSFIVTEKRQ